MSDNFSNDLIVELTRLVKSFLIPDLVRKLESLTTLLQTKDRKCGVKCMKFFPICDWCSL